MAELPEHRTSRRDLAGGEDRRKPKQGLHPRGSVGKAHLEFQRRTQLDGVDVVGETFIEGGTRGIDQRPHRRHERGRREIRSRLPSRARSAEGEKCPPSQIGRLPLFEQAATVVSRVVDPVDLKQVELVESRGTRVGERRPEQSWFHRREESWFRLKVAGSARRFGDEPRSGRASSAKCGPLDR